MTERDVIIVGSGPAGASCAKALRAKGIDVLVLEKEVLPRYKCCSGVLFGQTQELIKDYFGAEAPESIQCSPAIIEADEIREWNLKEGYRRYPWEMDMGEKQFSESYVNIWRNLFDKWLLDLSAAEYRDQSSVKSFEEAGDVVRVHVEHSGGDGPKIVKDYTCKYLIGADGGNSIVRRLLNPPSASDDQVMAVGILQSYFKLESLGALQKGVWNVYFLPDVGEMLTCVHQKDEYLLLCVGGFRGRKLRDSMTKLREFLSVQFGVRLGEWWRDEACQMQLAPPVLGRDRVLLTGEAANFIYLNGEGISAAIDSGYRCGQAVAQALLERKSALPVYAENVKPVAAHVENCIAQARFLVSQAV